MHGRIHEVGERPAAHVRLVGSVGGVKDAHEMVIRLAWALSSESRPATREGDQRELRVGAHRHQRRLGVGDQLIGRFLLAPLRGSNGVGKIRGAPEAELAGFLGEPCRLGRTRDRVADRAAVDVGPGFEVEALGEPRQPAVGPVSRHRGAKERKREVVGPYRHRGPTDGHRLRPDRAGRPATSARPER